MPNVISKLLNHYKNTLPILQLAWVGAFSKMPLISVKPLMAAHCAALLPVNSIPHRTDNQNLF